MAGVEKIHDLTLRGRQKLTMTGVSEVLSFEDTSVVLRTELGSLVVQGSNLQLKTLSTDGGQVAVEGTVAALIYEEPRQGGWLRRLLGGRHRELPLHGFSGPADWVWDLVSGMAFCVRCAQGTPFWLTACSF